MSRRPSINEDRAPSQEEKKASTPPPEEEKQQDPIFTADEDKAVKQHHRVVVGRLGDDAKKRKRSPSPSPSSQPRRLMSLSAQDLEHQIRTHEAAVVAGSNVDNDNERPRRTDVVEHISFQLDETAASIINNQQHQDLEQERHHVATEVLHREMEALIARKNQLSAMLERAIAARNNDVVPVYRSGHHGNANHQPPTAAQVQLFNPPDAEPVFGTPPHGLAGPQVTDDSRLGRIPTHANQRVFDLETGERGLCEAHTRGVVTIHVYRIHLSNEGVYYATYEYSMERTIRDVVVLDPEFLAAANQEIQERVLLAAAGLTHPRVDESAPGLKGNRTLNLNNGHRCSTIDSFKDGTSMATVSSMHYGVEPDGDEGWKFTERHLEVAPLAHLVPLTEAILSAVSAELEETALLAQSGHLWEPQVRVM